MIRFKKEVRIITKDNIKKLEKYIPILSILPLVVGTYGYISTGNSVSDSLYSSFALYFINPVSDDYNIYIEIARWTSALVTTTVIIYTLKKIWIKLGWLVNCLCKNSIAVYTDKDIEMVPTNRKTTFIYPENDFRINAKSHIIMFSSDNDSLKFYEQNLKRLEKSKVYIGLKNIEYNLIKSVPNVTYFDVNSIIARNLWKEIALWKHREQNEKISITILGTGHLGQNILNHGLLLNLYSLKQEITYNFIGDNKFYKIAHEYAETGNKDIINYYLNDDENKWSIIKDSDIVIVAKTIKMRNYRL